MKTLQNDLNRRYLDEHQQSQNNFKTTQDYNLNYVYTNPSKESKLSTGQTQMRNATHLTTINAPITTSNVKYKPLNSYINSSFNQKRQKPKALSPGFDNIKTSDYQSQRIFELNAYKNLCEELILKLIPNQKLPITRKDIDNLEVENIDIKNAAAATEKINNLTKEKNEAINALQKQSVINDQQRNHIDILKTALESSLVKNGIKINSSNNNSLNEIIDVSQLITENETIKNEYNKATLLINDLQNKIDKLQKENQDLSNSNIMLKQKQCTEKINNDLLSKQLGNESNNKIQLNNNHNSLQEQNKLIKNDLCENQSLDNKYKRELFENEGKLNDINNDLSSKPEIKNTFNETELLCSQLEINNQNLIKEKNELELSLQESRNQIKQLQNKQNELLSYINDISNKNSNIINDDNVFNGVSSNSKCNCNNSNNNHINTYNYNEELKNELNSKIKQISELENIVQSLKNENFSNIDHIKELSSKISNIISEKTKYETLTQHQNQQIVEIIQQTSDKDKVCESLTNALDSQYNLIQDITNIIIEESNKITHINNNLCSNQFMKYLNSLNILSPNSLLNPLDKLVSIKSYLKELLNEYYFITNENFHLNEENKQLNNKVQSLLHSITDYANNMHQANLYLENNESKLKQALDDNLEYKQANEDLIQKLNAQRSEIEKISLEVNDIIEQNLNLKAINQKLNIDNTDMERNIYDNECQVNELEGKIVILNKEINMYDNILNQICSAGNMKNISSITKDLINVVEEVSLLEREKKKLINEGKVTKGIENKINEKKSEYNVMYEMYQNELNKISPKKIENTFRKEINTEKYMYSNSVNNTIGSLRCFSPNNRCFTTSNNYHGIETDYDRMNTINSGEFSSYHNNASRI